MSVSFIRDIRIDGDVAFVPLTKGCESIIDAADVGLVSRWNWNVMLCSSGIRYARRNRRVGDGPGCSVLLMHRVITCVPDNLVVDHVNSDGLDNRRRNLRVATQADNMKNTRLRKGNTSGFKGVFWDKFTGRWMAAIGHNGKFHNLGRFDTREEAASAYAAAAIEKFGEYARLS